MSLKSRGVSPALLAAGVAICGLSVPEPAIGQIGGGANKPENYLFVGESSPAGDDERVLLSGNSEAIEKLADTRGWEVVEIAPGLFAVDALTKRVLSRLEQKAAILEELHGIGDFNGVISRNDVSSEVFDKMVGLLSVFEDVKSQYRNPELKLTLNFDINLELRTPEKRIVRSVHLSPDAPQDAYVNTLSEFEAPNVVNADLRDELVDFDALYTQVYKFYWNREDPVKRAHMLRAFADYYEDRISALQGTISSQYEDLVTSMLQGSNLWSDLHKATGLSFNSLSFAQQRSLMSSVLSQPNRFGFDSEEEARAFFSNPHLVVSDIGAMPMLTAYFNTPSGVVARGHWLPIYP